jgi:hypothetical protein
MEAAQPRQIKFNDATRDELIQFAMESLGMKFHPKTGLAKIAAGVKSVWRNDFITLYTEAEEGPKVEDVKKGVNEDGAMTVEASIRALSGGSSKNDPKVRMIISQSEGAGGQRPVFVMVNNVPMLLPRGEEIDVPYRYYLALRNAVGEAVEMDLETYDLTSRSVFSYPFQVSQLPTQEEMKDWNLQELRSQYPAGEAPGDDVGGEGTAAAAA